MSRDRRRHFIVLLFGLATVGCPRPSPPSTPQSVERAGALLIAPETHKNVGNVDFGVTHTCDFTIQNGGSEPLTLTLYQKSCSCGDVEAPEKIAPGEQAKVTFHWTPTPGGAGESLQFVSFKTNDPHMPLLRLEVKGKLTPAIRLSPEEWAFIDFEAVPRDKPGVKELRLYSTTLPSFTLKASVSDPGFSLETKPLEAGDVVEMNSIKSGYLVTLRTSDKATPGYLYDKMTLEVQAPNEKRRQIVMPVYADIENSVFKTTPMQVEFAKGSLTEGEKVPLKIEFVDPSDDEEIAVVLTEPAFVKADPPKRLKKGVWEIGVRLAKSDPTMAKLQAEGFFEGRVFLKTKGNPNPVAVRVKWTRPEF
jgi:hypothetical protein